MPDQLSQLRATVVDGRAQTPRFVQKQLVALHEVLLKSSSQIQKALCNDFQYTTAEAEVEYIATMAAIRQHFGEVDFEKALAAEYSIVQAKDNISKRVAVGCVCIRPSSYSIFYSVAVSVSAAIAAGNCVILEMGQTLSELNKLLRQTLSSNLSADSFAIVEKLPSDDAFISSHCVTIDSNPSENATTKSRQIMTPLARTVAVVDRTANIADAAQDLVTARLSFGGHSPYAPDIVYVNEFSLKDFCNAAAQRATAIVTSQVDEHISQPSARKSKASGDLSALKDVDEDDKVVLVSGSKGSVVVIRERNCKIFDAKIKEPMLLIHPIRSLDDAIDVANSSITTTLLAAYIFAAPAPAKYLSQFISARISCANHIPTELLVGPAAPEDYPVSIESRFTKDMFSVPRPEHVNFSAESRMLTSLLQASDQAASKAIKEKVLVSLPSINEPDGKSLGFFEQGIIIGFSLVLTTVVASAATAFVGYRRLRRGAI